MTPSIETVDRATHDGVLWHQRTAGEALAALGSGAAGLSEADAAARLVQHGPNELQDKGSKKPLLILWEQLTAVMVVILIGASLLSLALGKFLEAGAIGAIVVLFALLGFFQEYRAEQAIAALRRMAVPTVRGVRDGRTVEVPAVELVPGDLVHLEAGSVVPADLRLIEAANLRIQEATLTGESEPVDKQVDAIERADLALGDRTNMGYSGTQVTYGRGVGLVTATGMRTELGRIATLLQDVQADRTPLQNRLDRVGKQLALVGPGRRRDRRDHGRDRRRVGLRPGAHGDLGRRGRHPRGPARRRDVHARDRRAAHAAPQRPDPQAARSRDARLGDHDLLRQDGHAHPEPDDGHGDRRRQPPARARPRRAERGDRVGPVVVVAHARRRPALQRR